MGVIREILRYGLLTMEGSSQRCLNSHEPFCRTGSQHQAFPGHGSCSSQYQHTSFSCRAGAGTPGMATAVKKSVRKTLHTQCHSDRSGGISRSGASACQRQRRRIRPAAAGDPSTALRWRSVPLRMTLPWNDIDFARRSKMPFRAGDQ